MTFDIRRGTNVSHWLSQSQRRGPERAAFFTRDDMARIAEAGFDHVRLPVDEVQMWTDDGAKESEAWDLLDAALDWAKECGLRAIVDLHIIRSHYFLDDVPKLYTDPAEVTRFGQLWDELSEHLHGWDIGQVAYELLNESVAPENAMWNDVFPVPLAAIRAREPHRKVLIGSNRFNEVLTYDDLAVPDDEHLILTFHFYRPMLITHYRAGWTPIGEYDGPTRYPGQAVPEDVLAGLDEPLRTEVAKCNEHYDRDVLEGLLAQPLAKRDQTGLPLHCGEFGCYERAPLPDRLRWYRDVIGLFDQYDIAWSNWDYKGNFGWVDREGHVKHEILNALMGR